MCVSHSVMSDSLQPHGLHPTRLLYQSDFPGKNTGVGCYFQLQGICLTQGSGRFSTTEPPEKSLCQIWVVPLECAPEDIRSDQIRSAAQSCPALCDPMNRSTPGLPVHHQLLEFTETHVHRVSDAFRTSHPLSSPSPPAPNPSQHQSLFQ